MRQKEVLMMGAEELQYWMAYCSLQNDEFKKKIEDNVHLERQKALSDDERAKQLRSLFSGKK